MPQFIGHTLPFDKFSRGFYFCLLRLELSKNYLRKTQLNTYIEVGVKKFPWYQKHIVDFPYRES